MIAAIRGLAIVLPWMAAASVGAIAVAAAWAFRVGTFPTVFPYALGLCGLAGATGILWFRVSRTLAGIVAGAAAALALALAGKYLGKLNDGGMGTAIMIFYGLPLVILAFGKGAGYFGLVVLPVGGLILFLSGEFTALRQGRQVSVFDLPRGGWRVGVLVFLTLAPLAAFVVPGARVTAAPPVPRVTATAPRPVASRPPPVEAGCRTGPQTALSQPGARIYVDLDQPAWPDLKQVVETFATAHGLTITPPTRGQLGFRSADPYQYGLCAPGRLLISVSTFEDLGGRTFLFEPTGDRYVTLAIDTPPEDTSGRATLRELVVAIDARWPGTRFQSNDLYLGRSIRQDRWERDACRTRAARHEYADCLGKRWDVRTEALYVHGETRDWPKLQATLQAFAASHGISYTASKTIIAGLSGDKLCQAGKVLIHADNGYRTPGGPPVQGAAWGAQIDTYVAEDDPESAALIDALIATLDAEWPGVERSRPDMDFCRAVKAAKQKEGSARRP